jgi:plasmid stabilization system protein ParE
MVYSVNLAERAVRNIRAIYKFINAENSAPAAKWLDALEEAVFSLDRHPQRGQIIPEDRALRHLLYGNKPHELSIPSTTPERP